MKKYKTSAITLRTYDLNDFDKIAVLYSKEFGILRAVAKSVKKNKSSIGGMMAPLVASNLILNKGRNLDVIEQFELVDFFKGLKNNLTKITFASLYLELITAFGMEEDPHSEVMYEFLFDSLKVLESVSDECMLNFQLVQFEYKLISLVGYEPLLDRCCSCRKVFDEDNKIFIDRHTVSLFCEKCLLTGMNTIELSSNIYKTMLYFTNSSDLPYNISTSELFKLHEILFTYISSKTGFRLKTPKLIESLCLS